MGKKVPGGKGRRFSRGGPAGRKPQDENAPGSPAGEGGFSWLARRPPLGGAPRKRGWLEPHPAPRKGEPDYVDPKDGKILRVTKSRKAYKGKAKGRDQKR